MTDERAIQALETLSKLMKDAEYSDLTIKCQDRVFHVHKAIVCPASLTLKAAIQHGTVESITGTIEHTEFDAATVERMISYIYTADYTVSEVDYNAEITMATPESKKWKFMEAESSHEISLPSTAASQPTTDPDMTSDATKRGKSLNKRLVAHAQVFGLADYYNIPGLRKLATKKFFSAGTTTDWSVEGFIDVVKAFDRYGLSSDRQSRFLLMTIATRHRHELVNDLDFMQSLATEENAQNFAVDMLRQVSQLVDNSNREAARLMKRK